MTVHTTLTSPNTRAPSGFRDLPDRPVIVTLLSICLFLRMFIPNQILDLFEHYTSLGGSDAEKIHPAAAILLLLAAAAVFFLDYPKTPRNRAIAKGCWLAIAAIVAVSILGLATGRTQGFSYLIDSILLGPGLCLFMLRMNDRDKYKIVHFLIICLALNALVLFPEFILKRRVLPYDFEEASFRPTAFLGHPLINGLVCAVAIPFVWVTRWNAGVKFFLTFFFVAACFVAQARMASVFSVLAAVISIWVFLAQSVRKRKIDEGTLIVAAVATLTLLISAIAVIVFSGLAERLVSSGLNDSSSQARFVIYGIFNYMSHTQLLFGMPRKLAEYIIENSLKLPRSESSIVDYVIQFGIVGTAVIVSALLYFYWQVIKTARSTFVAIGVAVFIGVAATNNTFSSKGAHSVIIAALCMGSLGAQQFAGSRRRTVTPRAAYRLAPNQRARGVA